MKEKEIQKVDAKKVKPKNDKPNFFVRIGRKLKEVFSEIKKVSWPSFGKVVKQTGVVLGVVALFLVVISLMDFGLGQLLSLLMKIKG
ncbi:MAG: preprotein translocase subunit SecE [Clostridia bacterium]|nr:preprotein translocase subunit SecE [Clostridia bacterium]